MRKKDTGRWGAWVMYTEAVWLGQERPKSSEM